MEDKFYYIDLFLIYKNLLTEKEREVFELHFVLDLSLSEIAVEKGITRQNVSDTLKNAKQKLEGFEGLLFVKNKNDKIISLIEDIKDEKIKKDLIDIVGK